LVAGNRELQGKLDPVCLDQAWPRAAFSCMIRMIAG
jgi:hypothetical protein